MKISTLGSHGERGFVVSFICAIAITAHCRLLLTVELADAFVDGVPCDSYLSLFGNYLEKDKEKQ